MHALGREKIEELLSCIGTAEQAVAQLQWPDNRWTPLNGGGEVDPSAAAALAWLESLSEEGR